MDLVNVRTLRNHVSDILRRAESGERIIIGNNGRPIAQLGPLSPDATPTLWDLAGAGLIEPPRTSERPLAPDPFPAPVDVRVDRLLAEVRNR